MTRLLRKAGERMLGLFVPKLEAGACIPEHGQCCPGTRRYNCYGACKPSNC